MAERVRLIDFQRALSERIARASTVTSESIRVAVRAGGQHWLLRLDEIAEVQFVPQIDSIPLVRAWFRGLTNVRGRLVGVVDLSAFFGGEATAPSPENRIAVIADRLGLDSALLVGSVQGLRDTALMQPAALSDIDPDYIAGRYVDDNAQLWGEIDLTKLVSAPEFLQVEQSAAALA